MYFALYIIALSRSFKYIHVNVMHVLLINCCSVVDIYILVNVIVIYMCVMLTFMISVLKVGHYIDVRI